MTDCDSLYEHLMSQKFNSVENKRLAIDLMGLRELEELHYSLLAQNSGLAGRRLYIDFPKIWMINPSKSIQT